MEEKWLTEEWKALESLLPEGWEEKAKELGALKRVRKIGNGQELLRLLLLHVGRGLSLRQAVVRAEQWGLPQVSDVALLKRMRASGEWLRWMCQKLVEEQRERRKWALPVNGLRMLAVDGTSIQDPGPTGSGWRLHYAVELPGVFCAHAHVGERREAESLRHYELGSGDLVAADRGYCRPGGIAYALESGAHVLLRWHSTSLPLLKAKGGKPFEVLGWLRKEAGAKGAEASVWTKGGIALRLCAVAVSREAAERERARLRTGARKQGCQVSERSLELAGYVVLVCSLPREGFALPAVLGLYRLRWQVELAFKRLKSLLEAGHVPKTDPASARAWLQAKMLTCLLVEKLLLEAQVFSPWGFILPGQQPMVRVPRGPRQRPPLPQPAHLHPPLPPDRQAPSRTLRRAPSQARQR